MKTIAMALLFTYVLLPGRVAHADEPAAPVKKAEPTQAQLALDHGPHAQVTPAVKRARQGAAKAAPAANPSK